MMATSKKRDEEERRAENDEQVTAALALSHMMFIRSLAEAQHYSSPPESKPNLPLKKRKIVEKENSPETLEVLLTWSSNTPKIPPQKKIVNAVGECSKPIQKQLTDSDIKEDQNRLMLGKEQVKKKMIALLDKSTEIPKLKEGLEVTVYGPDGKDSRMMFKMWNETKTPVLTCGWKNFVAKYELEMNKDFLTIWMFRHIETRKICFAIDSRKFDLIEKPLSRKISNAVFKVHDSD